MSYRNPNSIGGRPSIGLGQDLGQQPGAWGRPPLESQQLLGGFSGSNIGGSSANSWTQQQQSPWQSAPSREPLFESPSFTGGGLSSSLLPSGPSFHNDPYFSQPAPMMDQRSGGFYEPRDQSPRFSGNNFNPSANLAQQLRSLPSLGPPQNYPPQRRGPERQQQRDLSRRQKKQQGNQQQKGGPNQKNFTNKNQRKNVSNAIQRTLNENGAPKKSPNKTATNNQPAKTNANQPAQQQQQKNVANQQQQQKNAAASNQQQNQQKKQQFAFKVPTKKKLEDPEDGEDGGPDAKRPKAASSLMDVTNPAELLNQCNNFGTARHRLFRYKMFRLFNNAGYEFVTFTEQFGTYSTNGNLKMKVALKNFFPQFFFGETSGFEHEHVNYECTMKLALKLCKLGLLPCKCIANFFNKGAHYRDDLFDFTLASFKLLMSEVDKEEFTAAYKEGKVEDAEQQARLKAVIDRVADRIRNNDIPKMLGEEAKIDAVVEEINEIPDPRTVPDEEEQPALNGDNQHAEQPEGEEEAATAEETPAENEEQPVAAETADGEGPENASADNPAENNGEPTAEPLDCTDEA